MSSIPEPLELLIRSRPILNSLTLARLIPKRRRCLAFPPRILQGRGGQLRLPRQQDGQGLWNEQWMGYPVGPQYAECSNVDNAYRLQGHLFLIVGEMDNNVPPESTFRFVDALIKAEKDFDLLVVPNGGHGFGGHEIPCL